MSACPHCQVGVTEQALFCDQCGKAVRVEPGFPRFVDSTREFATSAAGQALQAAELLKQAKAAFGALLAVAVLLGMGALLFWAVGQSGTVPATDDLRATVLITGTLAALFFGLAFWARKQPFPAAVTGLTIFVTLQLVAAVMNPATIAPWLVFKVIIILVLVRAVKAGAQHRKLAARMDPGDRERSEG